MCIIPSVYRESGQSAGVPVCWGYLDMIKRSSNRCLMAYYVTVRIQNGERHEENEEKEPEKEKNPIISACRAGPIDR